jgi:hypothetical protein
MHHFAGLVFVKTILPYKNIHARVFVSAKQSKHPESMFLFYFYIEHVENIDIHGTRFQVLPTPTILKIIFSEGRLSFNIRLYTYFH